MHIAVVLSDELSLLLLELLPGVSTVFDGLVSPQTGQQKHAQEVNGAGWGRVILPLLKLELLVGSVSVDSHSLMSSVSATLRISASYGSGLIMVTLDVESNLRLGLNSFLKLGEESLD